MLPPSAPERGPRHPEAPGQGELPFGLPGESCALLGLTRVLTGAARLETAPGTQELRGMGGGRA